MNRRAHTSTPPDLEDDLVVESIDIAAEKLNCGRSTIYKLLARGELHSVYVAGRRGIPRGERRRLVRKQLRASRKK